MGFVPLGLVSSLSQSSSDGGFAGGDGVVIVIAKVERWLWPVVVVVAKVERWLWPVVVVVVAMVDGRGGCGWCCRCFFGLWDILFYCRGYII